MTRFVFSLSHHLLWATITVALVSLLADLASAQTTTSTLVADGTVSDAVGLLDQGKVWAGVGVIIGLLARTVRLMGIRHLLGKGASRILAVVLTGLLGIAAGMVEGSLVIALESIVAAVMGIIGGEAAARKTERKE